MWTCFPPTGITTTSSPPFLPDSLDIGHDIIPRTAVGVAGDFFAPPCAVAVGGLLVEGAEVAGAGGVGSGQYLRHVVVFERVGQRESSHIFSIVRFDIWNFRVRHHV